MGRRNSLTMQKFTFDEINTIVAKKFKENEMTFVFSFLTNQIGLENDIHIKNKILLLKAECYQRIGKLKSAQLVLQSIDNKFLTRDESINVEILQLKVFFQQGDWNQALNTSKILIDQYKATKENILWRTSMLYAIKNIGNESEKYSEKHKDIIECSGFQEANNIVYTKTIPFILKNSNTLGVSLLKVISPVENAKEIYLKSNINFDTKKRIGSRLKSFCQAILIESFIEWDYGNKYDAYRLAILTGLCMAFSQITLNAEGIGEIIKLFIRKYKLLISIIRLALSKSEEMFYLSAQKYEDFILIKSAYIDALYEFEDITANDIMDSEKETISICMESNVNETTEKLPGKQLNKFK